MTYVVDHDSLLAKLVERHGSVDSAPIELNRATNAVDTAAENKYTMVVKGDIVGGGVVCSVLYSLAFF